MSKPTLNQEETKLYDLDHLLTLVNNDKVFVKGLIEIFIATIPPLAEELQTACFAENWEEVSRIAHKLKPTVETMRIDAALESVKQVELNAKEKLQLEYLPEVIQQIQIILGKTTIQLEEQLKKGL